MKSNKLDNQGEAQEHAASIRALPEDELPDASARAELVRRALAGQAIYASRPAGSHHFVVWVRESHPELAEWFLPMEWARLWHAGLQPEPDAVSKRTVRATGTDGETASSAIVPATRLSRRQLLQRLMSLFSLLLLAALLLTSCDLGPSTANSSSSTSLSITAPASVQHRGPLSIQIDPDITGSYPKALRQAFLVQIAGWLEALPRVSTDETHVYLTYINHAPYLPASTPLSFSIAPVPDYPQLPTLTPVPTCPNDPYSCASAKATVTTENAAAAQQYQQQLHGVQEQLAKVQATTTAQTELLRALKPATDGMGTSIFGVLNLASERFSGVQGDKWLLLATDLENNSNLDAVPPDLTGVHVLVQLYCPSAVVCRNITAVWKGIFRRAHVASIQFLDPAAAQRASSPWS